MNPQQAKYLFFVLGAAGFVCILLVVVHPLFLAAGLLMAAAAIVLNLIDVLPMPLLQGASGQDQREPLPPLRPFCRTLNLLCKGSRLCLCTGPSAVPSGAHPWALLFGRQPPGLSQF